MRAAKLMRERFPQLNQRQVEEALQGGLVTLPSGKHIKKGDKLEEGEKLDSTRLIERLEKLKAGAENSEVKIIGEETDFVVIDKPAGIASHPISLFDTNTITQWAFFHYPDLKNSFTQAQPTVVPHRLDSGTSGLLIVAKSKAAYDHWREKFHEKKVSKKYLAWCWGEPTFNEQTANLPLGHALGDRRKMVVVKPGGRYVPPILEAHSELIVIERIATKGIFMAEIKCSTGVTHQVRVHLSSLGFPLLGDSLYDPQYEKRSLKPAFHELRAIALACENWEVALDTKSFVQKYR